VRLKARPKVFCFDGIWELMDCHTNCNEKLGAHVENKMSSTTVYYCIKTYNYNCLYFFICLCTCLHCNNNEIRTNNYQSHLQTKDWCIIQLLGYRQMQLNHNGQENLGTKNLFINSVKTYVYIYIYIYIYTQVCKYLGDMALILAYKRIY
jgi:hypothetical protein